MGTTMYDVNSKFETFYEEYVRLSDQEINSLREKKNLNINRLIEGLKEYNDEKKTSYKVVDTIEQGSIAMRTVTQHDSKEYDIDIAVVFDSDNIPEEPKEIKKIVENALQRKCTRFKASPEAKTNAVTIEYASGYHIDFAIYRRIPLQKGGYKYEHCGSEWRERDPRAINEWFKKENKASDNNIRKVVRLLKMFCKQNSGWLMPGGLIQSILVSEKIQNEDRLDKTFYYTVEAIKKRLDEDKEVYNPTLSFLQSVLYKPKDHQKVKNLCTRLGYGLKKLDVLFDDKCTIEKAEKAWFGFFDHSFWGEKMEKSAYSGEMLFESRNEFLLDVDVEVWIHNKMKVDLKEISGRLPKGCKLKFTANPHVKSITKVEWIVNNNGDESEEHRTHSQYGFSITEDTLYRGSHTMTCKIYQGTRFVAQKVIPINIR